MHRYLLLAAVTLIVSACNASAAEQPTPVPPVETTAAELSPTPEASTPIPSTATLPPAGQEMLAFFPFSQVAVWTYRVVMDYDVGNGAQHWEGSITETVMAGSPAIENWIFHTVIGGAPTDLFLPQEHYYVVRGSQVYDLPDAESASAATNPEATEYARNQILAWPAEIGQMWGDPALMNADGRNVWRVEAIEAVDVPAGHFDGCARIIMVTNPDISERWFCPGTGFVKYQYHHNGTLNDQLWELESSTPRS